MPTRAILISLVVVVAAFSAVSPDVPPPSLPPPSSSSCDSLCSCEEKDGVLHVNCEARNISRVSQVTLLPGLPFHLNLYKNNLVELAAEDIGRLGDAVSLHLGANSIQELEPGVFAALGALKKLHVNSNFLVTLREDTFQGLGSLEFLQADTNFIRVVEPGAFSKLVRLKVLILNDNSVEFLPANVFRFVPLTHLDLRGNRLRSLPYVGLLEHVGRITELLLDDNAWACDCGILPLKVWAEGMRAQSAIGEVTCVDPPHLKGSPLGKVKRDVLCPSHADLDLEEASKSGDLVVTPSSKVVPKLKDAAGVPTAPAPPHRPTAFCTERCSCYNHPTAGLLVHCQDRGIQKVSELGPPQQSPKKLVLTGNAIGSLLRYDFVAYESLELLHLASNRIERVESEAFLGLDRLKSLYLNGNRLSRLSPGTFDGLRNLEFLYLEHNAIEDVLPGTFKAVPSLKLLSLNNNFLRTLPPGVFHGVPLATLNLRKNLFLRLPVSDVLDQLSSLEHLHLEDNPWDCSCDLVGLKRWVEKLAVDTVVGSVLCQAPRRLAGAELRDTEVEVMCPGLVTSRSFTANGEGQGAPTTATATDATRAGAAAFFHALTDSVPLSVLILSLLILCLTAILCSAGIAVIVLHRRRRSRSKKRQSEDQSRESPLQVQYSVYGQKTTHHAYDEPGQSPPPTYCPRHQDRELEDGTTHVCRGLLEVEGDSPVTGKTLKFRAVTEGPAEFTGLGDPGSLYRNILERDRDLQQLGIAEYLRRNLAQLEPGVEIQGQGRREELRLVEAIVYGRPRKLMVERSKNEYFELKANLQAEPDYLEVLEHQPPFN